MTNESIALRGTKELLQQARIDLVAAGLKDDKEWNDKYSVFDKFKYLAIYCDNSLSIHTHDCDADTVIDLTHENYTHIINLIKDKLCKK